MESGRECVWHCLGVERESVGADVESERRRLRSGTLAEALLAPGAAVVLRSGDRELTRDQLRIEAGQVAGGLAAGE
jgi:hypothetical protein